MTLVELVMSDPELREWVLENTLPCPSCGCKITHSPGCPMRFLEHPEDIPTAEERREMEFKREGKP